MSNLLDSGLVGIGGTTEEIVKKWSNLGLLEGIDGIEKIQTAICMDKAAELILNSRQYAKFNYDTVIFPVIRRVISGIKSKVSNSNDNKEMIIEFITAEYIMSEMNRLYEPMYANFEIAYGKNKDYDIECETSAFVSEIIAQMFVRSFKNKKILNKFDIYGNPVYVNLVFGDENGK